MTTPGGNPPSPDQPQPFASPTPTPAPAANPAGAPGAGLPGAGETVSFGGPPTGGTMTTLPAGGPSRPRRRGVVIGGIVGAVVLLGAGAAVWAVTSLSASGQQPEAFVPANAIAYADVDFDPAANQKVDAWQYLRKFESVDVGTDAGGLKGAVVRSLVESDGSTVDYARDVEPWFGDRAGVAVIEAPVTGKPDALVVLQVTDEDEARTSLRKLLDDQDSQEFTAYGSADDAYGSAADDTPTGLVVRDGYALIAEDQARAQRFSDAAAEASLADDEQYSSDMDTLGERGVATTWVDLPAVNALSKDLVEQSLAGSGLGVNEMLPSGLASENVKGRLVAALRFDGATAEVVARGVDSAADIKGVNVGSLISELPTGITGALAVGIDPQQIADGIAKVKADPALAPDLAELEQDSGLAFPQDLQALLGSGFAVVVDDLDMTAPEVAVRVRTDDPAASTGVLDKINARFGSEAGMTLVTAPAADGVVYAITPDFAETVATQGTLGADPAFTAAVPDAESAVAALYIDVDRLASQVPFGDTGEEIEPVTSVGMSSRTDGDDIEFRFRVVTR